MVKGKPFVRRRLGLAVVLAGATLATGATAELEDGYSARERRALAASGLPQASVVSVKSDMVVAIRGRGKPGPGGVIEGVTLQGEVISAETAQFLGYRSMRSTVNIDCARRRDLVVKLTVYAERGAKGAAVVRQVPGGWAQPTPDAYLAAVIREVCGPARALAAASPVSDAASVASARAATPAESRVPRAPAPSRAVELALAPMTTEVVGPDQPMSTSLEARRRTIVQPMQIAQTGPAPALRPEIAPPPVAKSAPPKPTPPKASTPKPVPAAPAKPRSGPPGNVSVQIAASPTEAQAREALAKVRRAVAPPLSTSVKTVVVDGKTYHRALVSGFRTRGEAQAFCAGLKDACFVR